MSMVPAICEMTCEAYLRAVVLRSVIEPTPRNEHQRDDAQNDDEDEERVHGVSVCLSNHRERRGQRERREREDGGEARAAGHEPNSSRSFSSVLSVTSPVAETARSRACR